MACYGSSIIESFLLPKIIRSLFILKLSSYGFCSASLYVCQGLGHCIFLGLTGSSNMTSYRIVVNMSLIGLLTVWFLWRWLDPHLIVRLTGFHWLAAFKMQVGNATKIPHPFRAHLSNFVSSSPLTNFFKLLSLFFISTNFPYIIHPFLCHIQ